MSGRTAIPRPELLLRVAAIVLLGFAVYTVLPGLTDGLPYLLPALLLLLVLAARRYPGERALLALMEGRDPRRRAQADAMAPPPGPRALVPRGGSLIATSLAVRPPPAHRAVALS